MVFAIMVFFGSVAALDVAWSFSDIANGLMAIPNLISLVVLSGVLRKDTIHHHKTTKKIKQK